MNSDISKTSIRFLNEIAKKRLLEMSRIKDPKEWKMKQENYQAQVRKAQREMILNLAREMTLSEVSKISDMEEVCEEDSKK